MTASEKAMKDGIRLGQFTTAHGKIDVALGDRPVAVYAVMTVLVYAWQGSGFLPEHHSLS